MAEGLWRSGALLAHNGVVLRRAKLASSFHSGTSTCLQGWLHQHTCSCLCGSPWPDISYGAAETLPGNHYPALKANVLSGSLTRRPCLKMAYLDDPERDTRSCNPTRPEFQECWGASSTMGLHTPSPRFRAGFGILG